MTDNVTQEEFEQWYIETEFDYEKDPIGSRDCGLQRTACASKYSATLANKDAEIQRLLNAIADHITHRADQQATITAMSAQHREEVEALRVGCVMKHYALERCIDDSREVLNEYKVKYGETYKPQRIAYQTETVVQAEQALNASSADVEAWKNELVAGVLKPIIEFPITDPKNQDAHAMQRMAAQLRSK